MHLLTAPPTAGRHVRRMRIAPLMFRPVLWRVTLGIVPTEWRKRHQPFAERESGLLVVKWSEAAAQGELAARQFVPCDIRRLPDGDLGDLLRALRGE